VDRESIGRARGITPRIAGGGPAGRHRLRAPRARLPDRRNPTTGRRDARERGLCRPCPVHRIRELHAPGARSVCNGPGRHCDGDQHAQRVD
jgi:hypothetical protein